MTQSPKMSQAVSPITTKVLTRETPRGKSRKFWHDVFFSNLPIPFLKVRAYLWVVFFSRALGPAEFGIWSLFQTTMSMAMILTSMTQGNAMMRFLGGDRSREEVNREFSSVMAAVSVSALLLAVIVTVFANRLSSVLFHDPLGRHVLLLIAVIIPFEVWFEEMRGLLRARRLNRKWALFTLGRQMPEGAFLIVLVVLWKSNVVGVIAGYLACSVLSVVVGLVYLFRYQRTRLVMPAPRVWSKYLPYGLALVPGALASTISFSADRYLVGYYLDLRQVGIYSVCFTVSALGFFLVGPLNDVLLPEISALYDSGDWSEFYTRFSKVQKFVIGVAMGATALLVAFPGQILRLLSSREFLSGESTLAILGLQGVFMSIVMLYTVLLCVRLQVWWSSIVWAGMGTLVLGVDVVLLPRIGIVGAGISQLLSSIAGAILVVALNWNIFHQTFKWRWLAQGGTAVLAVVLLAHYWQGGLFSIGRSLEQLLTGGIVFIVSLFATRYFRVAELVALRQALFRSPA